MAYGKQPNLEICDQFFRQLCGHVITAMCLHEPNFGFAVVFAKRLILFINDGGFVIKEITAQSTNLQGPLLCVG